MSTSLTCFGALALELGPEQRGARSVLERAEAERLAGFMARDLARLLPGVEALDGVFAAALFDPAEMLRPGWPVHAALGGLAEAAQGARGGRVIAFGASDGRMPVPELQPDPRLEGGLLRLLPFALVGESEAVREVGRQMEERLLENGMAQAHTALEAQSGFGVALEHARFMSLHDLCALTAAQYQHAGLEGHWRLIEAALLAPESREWLELPNGLAALHMGGQVRLAEAEASAWRALKAEGSYEDYRLALRQLIAILGAHGIAVERLPLQPGDSARELLEPTRQ
ncbi:hypothetical protein [Pseudomarimonas salicorniae]|uniref:Uncharacterized protein n=1 Tax=Pseudomarimonas salicorniae TaxID=2933270 RepID=A0ABT0GGU9_9GAMM|nr:hypothetical protein [Lysobacter sp. CAU 1642]MCK7593582.1 hypothetical protein [Lysobacter sp. CAU 1642]